MRFSIQIWRRAHFLVTPAMVHGSAIVLPKLAAKTVSTMTVRDIPAVLTLMEHEGIMVKTE